MGENIAVGFSVNAEIAARYNGASQLEKAPLEWIDAQIGGTSANVATAINKLGGKSKLLTFIGNNGDFPTVVLKYALKNCEINHKYFRILQTSHIAFSPDDGFHRNQSFGKKSRINSEIDPRDIDQVIAEIKKEPATWRVATGVRPEEVPFVEALFLKHEGYRALNPRMQLIRNKKEFHKILRKTDFLSMNMEEFIACEVTSPASLHDYGPSWVLITDSEKGGISSHINYPAKRFNAYKDYINGGPIYTIGAGDWTAAAIFTLCDEFDQPYPSLTENVIQEMIEFATRVSGKKITMPGSTNGPNRDDIESKVLAINHGESQN